MISKKFYDQFIGKFSLSKSLKFALNPIGKTALYLSENGVLENDQFRAEQYLELKKLCDVVHRNFIEERLEDLRLNDLNEFEELYKKSIKTEEDTKKIKEIEEKLRKEISKNFTENPKYKELKGKELIGVLKETFKTSEASLELINNFSKFTTYLKGFNENRANIYSAEEISTSIGYRIINENLPKFIENKKSYELVKNSPIRKVIEENEKEFSQLLEGKNLDEIFQLEFFNNTLSQSGIDFYNTIIGGKTYKGGKKVKGINEYINEYNQVSEKKNRVPKLKELFKQILSEKISSSFTIDIITNDEEVLEVLEVLENDIRLKVIGNEKRGLKNLIKNLKDYDLSKIYIKKDASLTEVSQRIFSEWNYILNALKEKYDLDNDKKDTVSYENKKEKYFKGKESFSIKEINEAIAIYESSKEINEEDKKEIKIEELFIAFRNKEEIDYIDDLESKYKEIEILIKGKEKVHKKGLKNDIANKDKVKAYLDSGKDLERFLRLLLGSKKEGDRDERFYSELEEILSELDNLNLAYNKIRNYITKKPYSKEKIKLNFNNPTLLDGWAKNKEIDNSCIIFKKKDKNGYKYCKDEEREIYYLGVMNNNYNKEFKSYKEPIDENDILEKMVYLQAADPAKDVQNLMEIDGKIQKKNGRKDEDGINRTLENLKNENLPSEINEIRKNRTFSREDKEKFNQEDLIKFIDFYKKMAIGYYKDYEFIFKESREYYSFKEFTDDINRQAYQIRFEEVSKIAIEKLVDEGKLYLFEIYNKDFSVYRRGRKNLHTIYFEMLFNKENLNNPLYKLNGQGEIFYRKKSIEKDERIIHYKGDILENKNKKNKDDKSVAVYTYDIVKDRRYTVDSFHLHIPITLNFGVEETKNLNEEVKREIKNSDGINIIGIDRGERNLLYVTVINKTGEIVYQKSFNKIVSNKVNGETIEVNYKEILEKAEVGRKKARISWESIQGIKDIKEGYLSQVIHEICQIAIKYNALIVLEDLNAGFKNSRKKFETSVYQKFEKMLIDKLNFYVDKSKAINDYSGALKAYQLTNKFESFKKLGKQSGILFYVPAWNTSKIDPTTGFVNLYNFKYENLSRAKDLIKTINRINYNKEGNFEFEIDYSKFNKKMKDTKKVWVLHSAGMGTINFRNKDKNNNWDIKEINFNKQLIRLFENYEINYRDGEELKERILEKADKKILEGIINIINNIVKLRKTIGDEDYILSPVKNSKGEFFDSRKEKAKLENDEKTEFPIDADANGAYNIARKGLMIVNKIKETKDSELKALKLTITNEQWLQYAQKDK